MTLALSCQYGGKNSVIHFDFEQLSIIPVVHLLVYLEFCLFQYIIFMFQNVISQSEDKFASEYLKRSKQKMSAGKKTIEEKQTILLESMQRLR